MGKILLLFAIFFLLPPLTLAIDTQMLLYKGQKNSFIDWENLDEREWFDLPSWLTQRKLRDANPNWRDQARDQNYRELFGQVLACIGRCDLFKNQVASPAQALSRLHEGDEYSTRAHSYSWIFLQSGTLIRLAPLSSITLAELNLGPTEILQIVRINYGFIQWIDRTERPLELTSAPSTDTIFLPLKVFSANIPPERPLITEQGLAAILQQSSHRSRFLEKINQRIAAQSEAFNRKRVHNFVITPSGSLEGSRFELDLFVALQAPSYFRVQAPNAQEEVHFLFRGYLNRKQEVVSLNNWYTISRKGDELQSAPLEWESKIAPPLLLTKRIPELIAAREEWLRPLLPTLFNPNQDATTLATQHGYRLWTAGELTARTDFIREYSRRIETTNLQIIERFLNHAQLERELGPSEFGPLFYQDAFAHYARSLKQFLPHPENELTQIQYDHWLKSHPQETTLP